jgi:hypothetical protein
MRILIVAISFVTCASGAFAQTTPEAPPSPPTQAGQGTLSTDQKEHPENYREPNVYRPCPASVVFPGNRVACLGLPDYSHYTTSRTLFPHHTNITVNWRPRHSRYGRGYFY